jgi:hypothetical protein
MFVVIIVVDNVGIGISSGGTEAVIGVFACPLHIVILLLIIAGRGSAMTLAALMRQGTTVGRGRQQSNGKVGGWWTTQQEGAANITVRRKGQTMHDKWVMEKGTAHSN